ncbi:MAG: serine protease [Bacteroidota bacterium]
MRRIALILSLTLLLGINTAFSPNLNTISLATQQSVVIVEASFGSMVKSSSGFCWLDANHVVTTLHGVAGSQSIKVKQGNQAIPASLERILLKGDLALLRLSRTLNAAPLRHRDVEVTPMNANLYEIQGYPSKMSLLDTKRAEFKRYANPPFLRDMISHNNKLRNEVRSQGYPNENIRIFGLETTIIPGHSGSPIVDNQGTVVAIADGGLHNGVAGLNWAIPASNLNQLRNSTDPIGGARESQLDILHSSGDPSRNVGGRTTDHAIFEADTKMAEIIATLPDDVVRGLAQMMKDPSFTSLGISWNRDLLDREVSVYMDYSTGLSFTLPKNCKLSIADDFYGVTDVGLKNGGIYKGSSGKVNYAIKTEKFDSYSQARAALKNNVQKAMASTVDHSGSEQALEDVGYYQVEYYTFYDQYDNQLEGILMAFQLGEIIFISDAYLAVAPGNSSEERTAGVKLLAQFFDFLVTMQSY